VPDLDKIRSSGKHLLGLINDVLDLSKIEAGKMEMSLETFEVREVVSAVAAMVRPLVEKNGNVFQMSIAADVGRCTPISRACGRSCSTCWATRASSRRREPSRSR
jgi:signal transduction histidine kinase